MGSVVIYLIYSFAWKRVEEAPHILACRLKVVCEVTRIVTSRFQKLQILAETKITELSHHWLQVLKRSHREWETRVVLVSVVEVEAAIFNC